MAQIMHPHIGQTDPGQQQFHAYRYASATPKVPLWATKNEVIVLPGIANFSTLHQLTFSVSFQRLNQEKRKNNGPFAFLRFSIAISGGDVTCVSSRSFSSSER